MNQVTVITLTRRRPMLVQRAIRSVQSQKSKYPINHMVLIDDCSETLKVLESLELPANIEVIFMSREPHEVTGPGRSSRLRNFGVQRAAGKWVAFLDDDNEWTEDHIESLTECAIANGVGVVYSHVCLLNPDGTPYLEPLWPWAQSKAEARRLYWENVEKAICVPGSNVVNEPDTSAWLFTRQLLLEVPFEEHFSESDAHDLVGEDDKLFFALLKRGEPFVCSQQATLKYYLGGYSNNPAADMVDENFSWATKEKPERPFSI